VRTVPVIEGSPWGAPIDTIAIVHEGDGGRRAPAARASVDDLQLAARLAAGDRSALADAYQRHEGLVYGMTRRVLRDDAMAEEVTQEVFVFLWEHPERFDPARGTMRSWLGMLAHRRAVDRVRLEVRRARGEARVEPVEAVTADAEVDDELSRAWLAGLVSSALEQLPTEQRAAVVLAYYGGRTYREVAAELGIPEGTAKSRLRLALAKLADILRPSLSEQVVPEWT
jgi:RNA polymerase sigma-70 factor (ECF subfamily)